MQVAESYLMAKLAPDLGPWFADRNAFADEELQRAMGLLQFHTQVGASGLERA